MEMERWLFQGMLAAAIMLPALNAAAWADDFSCSNATLQGEYSFAVTNYNAPQIHVALGIKHFDGKGNMIQQDYRGNTTPIEFSPPGQETGTYQVSPDCTGELKTQVSGGVVDVLFVISNGGHHIREVVASLMPTGSTQSIPVQTSADDWKVAPYQEDQQQ
jgi:hypothetical protein